MITRAGSENKAREVCILREIADVFVDVAGVDLNGLAGAVGRGEGNLVKHALHHRLQAARLGTIAPAALIGVL